MPKRIALFLLGLFLAIGAFLLYQYVGGQDASSNKKAKLSVTSAPTTLPMSYEQRGPDMQLEYVITAAESPLPVLDDHKNPIPGQFILKEPLATFYGKNGRIMQVSADLCQAAVEQGAKGAPGLSGIAGGTGGSQAGKLTDRMTLRSGLLRGHVRMTISPRPGAPASDVMGAGLRAYFDGDLVLDGIQEILTTTGAIRLRSERVDFDGQGMQLAFNREAKRIEYLRFDKGNRVIVRGAGARALDLTAATNPATKPASRPAPVQTQIAKPDNNALAPANYRMSFGQDIKATIVFLSEGKTAERTLASDRLFLTFMASLSNDDATQPATATAPGEADVAPPATLQVVENPEPIAPARLNDLVVAWVGSMEMRPTDDVLVNSDDFRLEAVGTAAKPVEIKDPRFAAQAGRLLYNHADQKIVLQPDAFKKVAFNFLSDSTHGTAQCAQLTYDQIARHATLAGPGTLETTGTKGDTTQITWKTHMDLDVDPTPDAKDPTKSTFAIRRAIMDGVTIKTDTFDLHSDNFDALIATIIDNGKQSQALEHLLATGNVVVHSARKTGAPGEQGGMQTERMEILTTIPPDSKIPVPSQLLADGNVTAWRFTEKGKGLAAALGATAPAGPVNPTGPADLQKESIVTPKLIATLIPKPKTAAAAAASESFAGLGQSFDVSRFQASGGARVEIAAPRSTPIIALADSIDAHPGQGADKGTATLLAAAGPNATPVRISLGDNGIQGQHIDLDQNTEAFHVQGTGTFNFTLPPDNKTRKTPTPMIVTWQDQMQYDNQKHLAIFTGKPIARMPGENSDQATLASDNTLTVQLKEVLKTATSPATGSFLANSNLDLDWMQADGNVQASGAQVGPDNKLLTRILISVPNPSATVFGKLHFSGADNVFAVDGPGALVVDNFRPDKPGDRMSTSGRSAFQWTGSLKYDGKASTVAFSKDVDFFFKPDKPFKFSTGLAGANTAPATAPQQPDTLRLHTTGQLIAILTKPKDAAGKTIESPIGLGSGGNQEVSSVQATGNPQIDLRNYHIAGNSMNFDVPKNLAVISGTVDEPVVAIIVGSGKRITGTAMTVDMTKDKNFFEVTGLRGDLAGFGQ